MKLWPLPKTAKIGAHVYKIIYPHHFEKMTGGKYHGVAYPNQETIRIDNEDNHGDPIHPVRSIACYFHEIIHEIDKLAANHLFDDNTTESEDKLEAFVELFLAFLIDNGFLENTWDDE